MNPLKRWAYGGSTLFLLVMAWWTASRLGPWPPHLFPGPWEVWRSLVSLWEGGRLWGATVVSMGRLAQGYGLSVLIGVPLGVSVARLPAFRMAVKPLLMGLQGLPSVCWLPLALLWFGLSDAAIVFVVVLGSLLSIAIATEDAVSGVDPQLLRVAGTLGLRRTRLWGGVLLPAALPGVVTGLKLGWSFAWRALMAGELLFVSGGLGQLLATGRELMEVPQVMAVMLAIVVIGTSVDRVFFQTVENRIRKGWGLLPAT